MSETDREAIAWGVRAPRDGRAWRAALAPPRPIPSDRAYVAAVRRLVRRSFPVAADYRLDYRLIAAVWRAPALPPSAWRPGGRAWSWVEYWHSTQARPERVGSAYNASPTAVAGAWARGLTVGEVRLLGPLLDVLRLTPGRTFRRRLDALCALARKRVPAEHLLWLATADLRRLAHLPGWLLRAALEGARGLADAAGRVRLDWPALAAAARLIAPHRLLLETARVNARDWLGVVSDPRALADVAERVADATAARWARSVSEPVASSWYHGPEGRGLRARLDAGEALAERAEARAAARRRQGPTAADWAAALADARRNDPARAYEARTARRVRRARALRVGGALVGWRGWRLAEDGVLLSPQQGTRWEAATLAADALPEGSVRGVAGIHAEWVRRGLPDEVIGRVLGHGRYAAGPEGWRAERATIDVLVVAVTTSDETIAALRRRYGCLVRRGRAS